MDDHPEEYEDRLEGLSSEYRTLYKLISNDIEAMKSSMRDDMKLMESRFNAEIYRLEARMYTIAGIKGDYIGVDLSLPSLGDSPTNPSYDLFTDRDYGLI